MLAHVDADSLQDQCKFQRRSKNNTAPCASAQAVGFDRVSWLGVNRVNGGNLGSNGAMDGWYVLFAAAPEARHICRTNSL
jgi:hypothetical protein